MNNQLAIYIYTHKDFNCPVNTGIYTILNLDNNITTNTTLNLLHDNIDIHIDSNLNKQYGETKGIYWLWKNEIYKLHNYIGLCHYRRYFNINNIVIDSNTIVLPNQSPYKIYESLSLAHGEYIANIIEEIIIKLFPNLNEYIDIYHNNYLYIGNMFIMPSIYFNDYCNFIFSIIDELKTILNLYTNENIINFIKIRLLYGDYKIYVTDKPDIDNIINYLSRIFGFIIERLSSIWFIKNFSNKTIIHLPIINI